MEKTHPLTVGQKVQILQGQTVFGKKLLEHGHHFAPENLQGTVHVVTAEHVKVKTKDWNIVSVPRLTANSALSLVGEGQEGLPIQEQLGLPPLPFGKDRALIRNPIMGDLALHIPDHRIVQVLNVEKDICTVVYPGESQPQHIHHTMLNAFFENPDFAPQLGFQPFEEVVGRNPLNYLNRAKCYLVQTEEELTAMLDDLYFAPEISLDTETRGLINDAFIEGKDFVLGICLAGNPDVGYYIPIGHLDPNLVREHCPHLWDEAENRFVRPPRSSVEGWDTVKACMYEGQLDRDYVVDALRELVKVKRNIMHNSTFDLVACGTLDLEVGEFCDTLIASRLDDENRFSHSLKMLVGPGYFSEVEGKWKHSFVRRKVRIKYSEASDEDKTLTYVHPMQCTDYAAADSADTYALNEQLEPRIKAIPSIWNYYQHIELPFIRRVVVNHIIKGGVLVRREPLDELQKELRQTAAEHREAISLLTAAFQAEKQAEWQLSLQAAREELHRTFLATFILEDVFLLAEAEFFIYQIVNLEALRGMIDKPPTSLKRGITSLKLHAKKPADTYEFAIKKADLVSLIHGYWGLPVVKTTKAYKKKVEELGESAVRKVDYSAVTKNTLPYLRAEAAEGSDARKFFDHLGKYRQVSKLMEAFTDPLLHLLDRMDVPYIHPDFNSFGAKSSRSSCRLPNLQQLPARGKYDVRQAFSAGEGYLFADCDFNSQELRVMAAFSRDSKMLELIYDNKDLHCYTVSAVWPELAELSDDEIKDKYKSRRNAAKAVMFGIAYRIGPTKLAEGLTAEALAEGHPENSVSTEQAKEIIDGFKRRAYPRLTQWFDEMTHVFKTVGYYDLPSGFRRRHSNWFSEEAEAASLRSCLNSIVQGTSAGMMKQSALKTLDRLEEMQRQGEISYFQINMIIHDQMIVRFKQEEAYKGLKAVEEAMGAELFGVPIPADGHLARSYSKGEEKWFNKAVKPAIAQFGAEEVFKSDLSKLTIPTEGDELHIVDLETPEFIADEVSDDNEKDEDIV